MIAERFVFRDRQGVHVSPEGYLVFGAFYFTDRVKPVSPVHDLESGVVFQKLSEPRCGFCLLHGEFGIHMQFMAEVCDLLEVFVFHGWFLWGLVP